MMREILARPAGLPVGYVSMELRQGTKIVQEYDEEFNRLRRFSMKNFGEQDMIQRFMRGLRDDIRTPMDLKRAPAKVTKAVESQKRTWDNRGAGPGQNGKDNNCKRCEKPGHYARECTTFLVEGNQ
ncbi:unnamed protein product [Arabidopsis thaliana]|uniref:(thale cress) hypothetical protein n=1 Tax=Arabidopsis thaliana TaxID=3702 RepID=A0A7G2E1V8_ARATH|nr:unnamed protein product [Arabidopsis thaliana]